MRKAVAMVREEVCWLDARSEDGWTDQDGLDVRLAEITTIGHVVSEGDVLCIACLAGIFFIPKLCIRSRRKLVYEDQNLDVPS